MRSSTFVVAWLALVTAVLSSSGCIHRHRGGAGRCADPHMPAVVQDNPPLKVAPGMTAPDTRNAVVVPPLASEGDAAKVPACLSLPPAYKG